MANGDLRKVRAAILLVLLLFAAGCGNGEKRETPATPAKAKAKATATGTPAPGALERYTLDFGISALMPTGWKAERQAKYHGTIFSGPEKNGGAIGFYVEEKNDTPQEWLDNIVLSDTRFEVKQRRKVMVPGLGKGIRVTLQYPGKPPQYDLYVATIDGVFVEITVHPGSHLTKGQVSRILTSVRRKV